jgi:D-arabinose 1-dehydrogenase-like Zn-dependent alcohol dehydrogenase
MGAIVLEKFGGPDSLVIKEIPEPEPRAVHVVIQVKAFGINHAEMHMRRGEWAKAAPVSGIECVGPHEIMPRWRVSGRRESGGTDGGSAARSTAATPNIPLS